MNIVKFMNWGVGRTARVLVGSALIAAGVVLGGAWLALSIVGLLPPAGAFGFCLLAPLFGQPMAPATLPVCGSSEPNRSSGW